MLFSFPRCTYNRRWFAAHTFIGKINFFCSLVFRSVISRRVVHSCRLVVFFRNTICPKPNYDNWSASHSCEISHTFQWILRFPCFILICNRYDAWARIFVPSTLWIVSMHFWYSSARDNWFIDNCYRKGIFKFFFLHFRFIHELLIENPFLFFTRLYVGLQRELSKMAIRVRLSIQLGV